MKKYLTLAGVALVLSSMSTFAADLSKGHPSEPIEAMDANKDGMISKEEFMKYQEAKFDSMKNAKGLVPIAEMVEYLRGPSNAAK